MHRRLFLKQSSLGAAGCALATPARPRHTEHLIFIVNGGGARKKDYYENDSLCPNIRKIDDEVNHSGQLHHSEGFYCTHRVASIFWGPDFVRGVDRTTVITRLDMAPTLAWLFGGKALYAAGRVMPGLFKMGHCGALP